MICIVSLLLLTVLLRSQSQEAVKDQPPELTLRIILGTENYFVRDMVSPRAQFTNVTNTTLCFPEPPLGYVAADMGVLTTSLKGPEGHDNDEFPEGFDGRGTASRKELLRIVKEHWVWLGPNESYTTKSVPVKSPLDVPGQWRVEMSYRPPEGSFQSAKYRKYLSSVAKSAGCRLPQIEVTAQPISLNVSMR